MVGWMGIDLQVPNDKLNQKQDVTALISSRAGSRRTLPVIPRHSPGTLRAHILQPLSAPHLPLE